MAQVELQVIVKREQVDQLKQTVNELNNTTINLKTSRTTSDIAATEKATRQLLQTEKERQRVEQEVQKTAQQTAKAERERQNAVAAAEKAEREKINTERAAARQAQEKARAQREANNATKEGADAQRELNQQTKQGGPLFDILGRSLSSFIARMTMYRAVYAGIAVITNGFRQAIETMKEVDKEMIAVKKVTGFSDTQMAAIENQSYTMASKYGTGAADYMASVADFARAGYMELAPALAELSVKTQIVGDTTAEVANQFLLSVDKAYQYQGSIEKLTAVLDGADIINNKYATSVERIAEGLGIVAPVASQMHVGVDELTAALGTITAVTQRSGSEAARALRALFLNIVGDTKTEIDEGVTWTTGEIAGLQDVIRKFAPEAYEYAKATQTIIDPMRAMEGLAKSMKEGLLTEQELMTMVSDIGGKLRTSQLLALIENWDMYESMLKDYQNAAGTADREVEMYMDSWEAKANQLKNTFTEFVRETIDPQMIKDILDWITKLIKGTDSLKLSVVRLIAAYASLKLMTSGSKVGAVVGAIGLAVTAAWSAIARAQKEAAMAAAERKKAEEEAAREAVHTEQAALSESNESISRNKERLDQLEELRQEYLKITSAKYDEETRDSLLAEWKNKLAEAYGVEQSALEKVNAVRQTGLDLLKEERDFILDQAYNQGMDAYLEAQNLLGRSKYNFADDILDEWSQGNYALTEGKYFGSAAENSGTQTLLEIFGDILHLRSTPLSKTLYDDSGNWLGSEKVYSTWGSWSQLPNGEAKIGKGPYATFQTINGFDTAFSLHFNGTLEEYIVLLTEAGKKISDLGVQAGYLTDDQKAALGYINQELEAAQTKLDDAKGTVENFIPILAEVKLKELGIGVKDLKTQSDYANAILNIATARQQEIISAEDTAAITEWLIQQIGLLTKHTQGSTDALDGETAALGENEAALEKDATAAEHAAAAKKDAEAAARKLIPALFDENGELTATAKEALAASSYLADLVQAELNAQKEAAAANYARLRAELAATGKDALRAMADLTAFYNMTRAASYAAQHGLELHAILPAMGPAMGILAQIAEVEAAMAAIDNQITAVAPYTSGYSSGSSSGSSGGSHGGSSSGSSGGSHGGSSSSSASTEDKKLKALQDRIKLLKSELSLMKERGDSEEDQIAKMREIQKALENEWKYLQSIGGDQVTINNLMQEWYSIENQIADLKEKEADDAERQAEAIQKAVEAQLALNNALSNRNVRIYNAKTGQWEWVANPNDVASALKNYNDAVSGFSDADMAAYRAALAREMQNQSAFSGAETYAQTLTPILQALGATHNGNNYNFAGLTFSEAQARTLTLYDLAQMARNLAIA